MTKTLNEDLVKSEFEPLSFYYVHFQTNTIEEGMNLIILPPRVYLVSLLRPFLKGWLWH